MNMTFLLTSLMFGGCSGVLVNIALGEKAYNVGGILGGLLVGGLIAVLG